VFERELAGVGRPIQTSPSPLARSDRLALACFFPMYPKTSSTSIAVKFKGDVSLILFEYSGNPSLDGTQTRSVTVLELSPADFPKIAVKVAIARPRLENYEWRPGIKTGPCMAKPAFLIRKLRVYLVFSQTTQERRRQKMATTEHAINDALAADSSWTGQIEFCFSCQHPQR
jgi:hypothetical protein